MTLTKGFALNAATTPLDARLMDLARVVTNSDGSPRVGLLSSNINPVSANAAMSVTVQAAEFVTSKGRADGVFIFTNDGAVTVALPPAPVANSRIDVIWVKYNDTTTSDATDGPVFGVTSGDAAASPTKPAIPTGALELATQRTYAGTTAANQSPNALANTAPLTAMKGGEVLFRSKADLDAWTNPRNGQCAAVIGGDQYHRDSSAWIPATGFLLIGTAKGTTTVQTGSGFTDLNTSPNVGTDIRNDGYTYGVGTIAVPRPGIYAISAQVSFPSSTSGTQRGVRITANAETYTAQETRNSRSAGPEYVSVAVEAMPVSGGFQIGVRHDMGSAQSIELARVSARYLGPL